MRPVMDEVIIAAHLEKRKETEKRQKKKEKVATRLRANLYSELLVNRSKSDLHVP